MYYAGIGSRRTPPVMLPIMSGIAESLRTKGYTLRSGHAPGADLYFEAGAADMKEIYLPWKGFNGSDSPLFHSTVEAEAMAERYHPRWDKLTEGAKKMMARNCHQVLGMDLNTPVEFVVCWTPNGGVEGGTGQAMRIAMDLKIPVYNIRRESDYENLIKKIKATRLW